MTSLLGPEKALLSILQAEFPLVEEPFVEIGRKLEITAVEVIELIAGLKTMGIVRQIGPVIDARRLGFQSTLVAASVPAGNLARAEQAIAANPGVSHGYERDHRLNVWFTLSVPAGRSIEGELPVLKAATGASEMASLPALTLYKIGAYFDVEGGIPAPGSGVSLPRPLTLAASERAVVNALQQDLPLTASPFAGMAAQAGVNAADFLGITQRLIQAGAVRRYSASINHRQAGFAANAMTCWEVPPLVIDGAGETLAGFREISHCYERQTTPQWQYNLFAMVHGHTREETTRTAQEAARQAGLDEGLCLFSTHEFKKTRVVYHL